jgi:hypothetical protein
MRDKDELLGLKSHQLTPEEIEELGNMDLNLCDRCGIVEISEDLVWIDCEEFWDGGMVEIREETKKAAENLCAYRLTKEGQSAVCNPCFDKEMVLDSMVLRAKLTLEHFNEFGQANFNSVGGNTSTFAFLLEWSIKDYQTMYDIDLYDLEYLKVQNGKD